MRRNKDGSIEGTPLEIREYELMRGEKNEVNKIGSSCTKG